MKSKFKPFKNVVVYSFSESADLSFRSSINDALLAAPFQPCSELQQISMGFVKPLPYSEEDCRAHGFDDCDFITLKIQSKSIPGGAVKKIVNDRIEQIEVNENRKVSGREKAEIKDRVINELLPKALPQDSLMQGYIDYAHRLIIVNASSAKKAENYISCLRKSLGGLPVTPYATLLSPQSVMTSWLSTRFPDQFVQNYGAILAMPDDGAIKIKNVDLLSKEVTDHLQSGGEVSQISLIWEDRVNFDLTNALLLQKIIFTDLAMEEFHQEEHESEQEWDKASFLLFSSTLNRLLSEITEAMGGSPQQ